MRRIIVILSGIAIIALLALVFGHGVFWGTRGAIDVVYPIDGSIFPPDLVAPTFLWRDKDSEANHWSIEVAGEQGSEPLRFYCEGDPPPPGEIDKRCISETNEIYIPYIKDGPVHSWTPNDKTWKRIQQRCGESGATVTIVGYRDQKHNALSRGRISISVSKDPVGASIFYRDVPIMPTEVEHDVFKALIKEALPLISWRLRDISKPKSRVVMTDMPSCANCHTFSSDGKILGMDVDGPDGDKGAYAFAPIKKKMVIENKDLITWNSFQDKFEGHKTIGFMSQVSPDGRYVATTVNESIHFVNFPDYKFVQVFYPTRGILAYYSRRTGRIEALKGADNPEYVHCNPTWSPDNKYLVFARAKAKTAYIGGAALARCANDPRERQIQYDLYRIPFNDGRGGTPEPVPGASKNGMSNSFPRISPDGRWLVFVKCRNGLLMRPDSRLWIVPTAGGQAREMRCNTSLMNSWHSFSPNGRWMVFSSKTNTPYTQMFLTHIDKQGRDSPAVLIPNSTAANRAVNLPEFVNIASDELIDIDIPVVDWRRPLNRGNDLLRRGKLKEALEQFREALHIDPKQAQAHFHAGLALDKLKFRDEAVRHYTKTIELNPKHAPAYNNLGIVLGRQGKFEQAIEYFRKAIAADPVLHSAHGNLGKALMHLGKVDQAVHHFRRALEIEPTSASARINLKHALRK
ncbi:MAG: tetratricopeptide repeat protein [Phycisphaerae bacterium]|nr:tetratricopeptide repeat protein [Phycisphaerae bacterium]